MTPLNIGIISENLVQQHYLHHIVQECGHTVAICHQIDDILSNIQLLKNQSDSIDAWLVDVNTANLNNTARACEFEEWLYDLELPVIFSEGQDHNAANADFDSWSRQLKSKLLSLKGRSASSGKNVKKAELVWVLAASTGGPAVIKRFLDVLPTAIGIGFIYVQHIDVQQSRTLAETISRDSSYSSYIPEQGDLIATDSVVVVPANVMEIQKNGTVVIHEDQVWRGHYSPSIDQVTANVGDIYGSLSGAIFFTGMGDDGAMGSRLMAIRGGNIWIQLPDTCDSPSMPKAIEATGYVTKQGTPEQLAAALVEWAGHQSNCHSMR